MKVLQINAVYEYSSTGRTTQELHEFLLSRGVESYVAAINVRSEGNFIRLSNSLDGKVHKALSMLLGRQGFYSLNTTHNFIKKIDEIKPDIIHLRVLHSNCINLPILLRYIANKNIVTIITLHDCWFFTGHCCYFSDSDCERWKIGCGNCPDLKNWNRSLFFDRSSKNLYDKEILFGLIKNLAVVGVSDWVTNFVQYSIFKNAHRICRIYNWIDINKFFPHETHQLRRKLKLEHSFVILGVAQAWSEQKGILDFLQLAKICPQYKFLLVGKIPYQYYPLSNNIISIGVLSDLKQLSDCYALADVFFNPSQRETFGKVTLEAQACGTPVVTYNLTANPELVPVNCGYIVNNHDLNAVKLALDEICQKGKESYLDSCRNFVATNFNSISLMNSYLKLYEEMLNNKVL